MALLKRPLLPGRDGLTGPRVHEAGWVRHTYRSGERGTYGQDHEPTLAELLAALAALRCLGCRATHEATRRYFFWYLAEQYGEPNSLQQLATRGGFCLLHTRLFLAHAPHSTVACVYQYLIADALRSTTAWVGPRSRQLVCPVCAAVQQHVHYWISVINATDEGARLRKSWQESGGLCWAHYREMAPHLALAPLELCTEVQRANQANQHAPLTGDGFLPADRWTEHVALGSWDEGTRWSWSPSLTHLQALLTTDICPCCYQMGRAVKIYFAWIIQEMQAPERQNDGSRVYDWCWRHALSFLAQSDADSAKRWTARAEIDGQVPLGMFAESLGYRPRVGWGARWGDAWRQPPEHPGLFAHLADTTRRARVSWAQIVQHNWDRAFPSRPCPVCVYQDTVARRWGELLGIALGDPETRRQYAEHAGLCVPHMRCVLPWCRAPDQAFLLDHQKTRLAVLHWELQEILRKQDWNRRYDPQGPEQGAGVRAAHQFSGASHLVS